MTAFRALLAAESRLLIRDRVALFFTIGFPLVFILIFGFVMGDVGETAASLGLYVASGVEQAVLQEVFAESGVTELRTYPSEEALVAAVTTGEVEFGASWDGADLRFVYHANRVQENPTYETIARSSLDAFELRRGGLAPAVPVRAEAVGGTPDVSWFHQLVPGILAFSILASGLFAVSGHVTGMKERGTLARLTVTPMRPVTLLAAIMAARLTLVLLSTTMTLLIAWWGFRLEFAVNWLRFVGLVACSTVGTMGLGTIIALVVRRASSAANVANVLSMGMLFLSGVYFPIEFLPGGLRALSQALPLRHMAEAMRFAIGVRDMSVGRFWGIALALAVLGIVLLPLLARYVVRADRR